MSAIGLRVGPFEICDEVDVPGAGAWYRARRTGLTRRKPTEALIRLLGPAPTTRELAAVQRHFDVLRAVDDPRFPRAIALYEGSGALAVDTQVGPTLDRVVEARLLGDVTMTPATLLDLALDLTDAMAHAHGRGLHHGHLSAHTITQSPDGGLVIWGLGASDTRPPFSWLAPERARGEASTAMTDQWSLGALIVSLVTGRTPWSPGNAEIDPRSGNVDGFVEPLARQWPALGRLVRRLMDPNPDLRFPSLHPVRLELLGLSRRAGGTTDRRGLAAWLHRSGDEAPVEVEVEVEAESAETPRSAAAPSMPPPSARVPIQVRPAAVATPVSVEIELEPDDAPPEIHAAHRHADGPAPKQTFKDARPLPAEAMAVVYPDEVPEDMPVTGTAPPRKAVVAVVAALDEASDGEAEPTEFAEDVLPTEMATELVEDEEPMVHIPPVRARASGPEPLRPSLRMPTYSAEPAPTLPGMEVPEPRAARPILAVQIELEDEDEGDDLLMEDPLLEDITGEIRDARMPVEPEPEPAPEPMPAPTPLTVQPVVAVHVQLDDEDEETPRRAAPTVVPFTDPLFEGADLAYEQAETPAPTQRAEASTQAVEVSDEASSEPELGLETFAFIATAKWPWERDDREDPEPPEQDPVVRAAPYVASVAVGLLALTLVVNVIF